MWFNKWNHLVEWLNKSCSLKIMHSDSKILYIHIINGDIRYEPHIG